MKENREKIDAAREILGIGDSISITGLRRIFRQRSLLYHTDHCREEPAECRKKFNELREAYLILLAYCETTSISLTSGGEDENRDAYDHLDRFYDGWLGDL